jgi:hypothetical protein
MKAAWAAARLRAPDAVLMISRRGVRFFAADDLVAPAWWLSVAVRDPAAARGRAVVAPAADFWRALRATWWRGRGGNRVSVVLGAVRFGSPAAAVEVRGGAVDFGAGAGIPISEDDELMLDDYYPVAVADAPSTISAYAAAAAARSDVAELRFARDDRGWWLEVAGDGEVRRAPAQMLLLPPSDAVIGRYPAAVLAELLSLLELAEPTIELTEPPERPALYVSWEATAAKRARAEFFVAPLA